MKRCNPCPNPLFICSCILHPSYSRWNKNLCLIDLDAIVSKIADYYGAKIKDLKSPSRKQDIMRIRRIAIKECRKQGATLEAIGKYFNRNHSTILYHLNY